MCCGVIANGDIRVMLSILLLDEGEQQVYAPRELEMWPQGGQGRRA